MSPLRVFTAFHANLDFSALPDADVPRVLERCYWPLLRMAEELRLPLGIEMPARTLERVARDDPEWVKSLRALCARGLVEVVGSGLAQIVAPLVPTDVNRANLAAGRARYEALLGAAPTTWFVNEQTFSPGLAPLYADVGAHALVVEWNNPASARAELRPLRHLPARIAAGGGRTLTLLWNDCVQFQRVQRAAHGEIPLVEGLARLLEAAAAGPAHARLACAYGGDLEIFDYRPGRPAPDGAHTGVEMARLRRLLEAIAHDPRFAARLPRDAYAGLEPGPIVELASAADPIPCKKQPRYNPTRWVASGRDALGLNTRCYRLRRLERAAVALGGEGLADAERLALWRSDLRTRATAEKLDGFHEQAARADAWVRAALEARTPPLPPRADVLLVNASPESWDAEPVAVELRLAPGRMAAARVCAAPASALEPARVQVEPLERHRDGSLRRVRVVAAPQLEPGGRVALRLEAAPRAPATAPTAVAEVPCADEEGRGPALAAADAPMGPRLVTATGEARFLAHRGGALEALRFPALGEAPLAGTLAHGSFDHIAYTPDFYSGHVVAFTDDGRAHTSLTRAEVLDDPARGPLRHGMAFRVETALGPWVTRYRLYADRPRLDVVHELHFHEARVRSLRLGTVTLRPEGFARAGLAYATVNGGAHVERHALAPGVRLEHSRAVSPLVSATSCLGATGGWVSVDDGVRGLAVLGSRATLATAPLLDFADVDERFFLRLQHTAAESDENRATFLRGTLRTGYSLVGHAADAGAVAHTAGALERGLLARTEQGVDVVASL